MSLKKNLMSHKKQLISHKKQLISHKKIYFALRRGDLRFVLIIGKLFEIIGKLLTKVDDLGLRPRFFGNVCTDDSFNGSILFASESSLDSSSCFLFLILHLV